MLKNTRIRTTMAKTGITQGDLAKILGVSEPEISYMMKYELSKTEADGIIAKIREYAADTA